MDDLLSNIKDQLNDYLHSDWLGSLLVLVVVLLFTIACSRAMHAFLVKVLKSDKGTFPQASIFINIGRFIVWSIGICIILSTCFGVNVQAAVTALGIGGIAISLGFQSTLSNLIGGLQIVLGGIIEPGDRIKIAAYEGVVHDITWRHTTIVTPEGETVVVPNALINSSSLQKLHPQRDMRIAIEIHPGDEPVDDVAEMLEQSVDDALQKAASVKKGAEIDVVEKDADGYGALLSFVVSEGSDSAEIERRVAEALGSSAIIVPGDTIQPADDRPDGKPERGILKSLGRKLQDGLLPDGHDGTSAANGSVTTAGQVSEDA